MEFFIYVVLKYFFKLFTFFKDLKMVTSEGQINTKVSWDIVSSLSVECKVLVAVLDIWLEKTFSFKYVLWNTDFKSYPYESILLLNRRVPLKVFGKMEAKDKLIFMQKFLTIMWLFHSVPFPQTFWRPLICVRKTDLDKISRLMFP